MASRVCLSLVMFLCVSSAWAATPTFQSMMDPSVFPEAQRGMVVERAAVASGNLRVVTTGAELLLDASGKGTFRQRIGHARDVVSIEIEGGLKDPELTHNGPGFAFARFASPKLDLRVNGDSLFMFHAREPVTVTIMRAIEVEFSASYLSNCVMLDEWGGFGLFCSDKGFAGALNMHEPQVAHFTIPADGVLWIGICPPKPYDWDRSFKDHVVWHWSNQTGYPADSDLVSWANEGNIVLLQSEVMLWKDWNLAFVPRLGAAEFARARKTIHDHGMRFIVYTSPYYFLKGTPLEPTAMNSFDHFAETGFPSGWPEGSNIDLFMAEIGHVMSEYKPDGLYFDGQYTENPAGLYALARRARGLLGEDGILEWHSTTALGNGLCFLPQADAYVDFILRGEGRDGAYADFNYLRYFVSCYNSSNSIGVLCNNGSRPTSELIARLLDANGRMHTIAGWLADPKLAELIHNEYRAKLGPALREKVEHEADLREGKIAEHAKARADEFRAIENPPKWNDEKPLFTEKGEGFLKWTSSVSSANKDPFTDQAGALAIAAKAHTYAFLTRPVSVSAKGFVVKMKQHTDGGMSWGPAVFVKWKNGTTLRIGLRSDGLLQADFSGEQHLIGKQNPKEWIFVRVRWLQTMGVVETSPDGKDYTSIWRFEHGGAIEGDTEAILVGKVPYNGTAIDNTVPGDEGQCFIENLALF